MTGEEAADTVEEESLADQRRRPARLTIALRFAAGLAVSTGCLLLAARSVPIRELWSIARALPVWVALLCLSAASSSLFLRAMRWRLLLEGARPVTTGFVFAVNSAGQMGNSLLPARLGDVFRATNLSPAGISSGFALATVFVERVLDTGFLVLLSAVALGSIAAVPAWLARASRVLAGVALGGLAFALLLPLFEAAILRAGERVRSGALAGQVPRPGGAIRPRSAQPAQPAARARVPAAHGGDLVARRRRRLGAGPWRRRDSFRPHSRCCC
jgi:hypothetical protein